MFGKKEKTQKGEFVIKNGELSKWRGDGTTLTIPEEVTIIGPMVIYSKAFKNVTEITFPAGLQEIRITDLDFYGCFKNIKRMTICGNMRRSLVEKLVQYSHDADIFFTGGSDYEIIDGLLIDKSKNTLLLAIRNRIKADCIIPQGIVEIGSSAFKACERLERIVMPDSLTKIGFHAFERCKNLKKVIVQNNVTTIDNGAFSDCESLEESVLPENLSEINSALFSGCIKLRHVNIPQTVQKIGHNAFFDCRELDIPLDLPETLIEIGFSAFRGCKRIKSLSIGKNVKHIGEFAFEQCEDMEKVLYNATNADDFDQLSNCIFNGVGWTNGVSFVFGDSVEKIPAYFFGTQRKGSSPLFYGVDTIADGGHAKVKEITFSESITEIGEKAFFQIHPQKITVKKGSYCEQFAMQQWGKNIEIEVVD